MDVSIEDLYRQVGRDDRVAVINFIEGSDSHKKYHSPITVALIYSANERENLEKKYQDQSNEKTSGNVKARFLTGAELKDDQIEKLEKEGFNSADVKDLYIGWANENLYYEEKVRSIRVSEIKIQKEPKGADNDWIYGFFKREVRDQIGFDPYHREQYLALKKFYEEEELTTEELDEMNQNGIIKPEVELKFLEVKMEKEVSTPEEDQKFEELLQQIAKKNFEILKKEITDQGVSVSKFAQGNPGLFKFLLRGTMDYIPERFNVFGKKPIYMDWKGFLHVYLRHVEEFRVSPQMDSKGKHPWSPKDVAMVIRTVIQSIEEEIQEHFDKKPGQRFSKYGDQSLYFQGDYYTFHIDADGRLSTFHTSKKKI